MEAQSHTQNRGTALCLCDSVMRTSYKIIWMSCLLKEIGIKTLLRRLNYSYYSHFFQICASHFFQVYPSHFFQTKFTNFFLLVVVMLLSACSAEQRFSTQYPCSFVYYANYHPTSALSLCLGNPGHFTIVEPKMVSGLTHLMMTPNQGNNWTSDQVDVPMRSAIENDRLSYDRMGANKRLVIGLSFTGLKAFDGQCPNCLQNGTSPNRPLSWADNGQMLMCAHCKTKYNPNAEGIPTNGREDTPRLIEYRIEYNGDRLYVHN